MRVKFRDMRKNMNSILSLKNFLRIEYNNQMIT